MTDDSATLEWSPPSSTGGADIIGYPVERRESGRMNWVRIKRVEPDITWFTVENLLEGRGYVFRVFAENCEGLSEPAVIEKTVVPQRKLGKAQKFNHYCWILKGLKAKELCFNALFLFC